MWQQTVDMLLKGPKSPLSLVVAATTRVCLFHDIQQPVTNSVFFRSFKSNKYSGRRKGTDWRETLHVFDRRLDLYRLIRYS